MGDIKGHWPLSMLNLFVPKKRKVRKASEISLAELKPEDFAPVKREQLGKSLAKLATAPKAKK